jgi:hypothetical protein
VADAHFGPIRTYSDSIVVNDADLFNRVRKLLDKATATTNTHEAEAFSQKAASLIASHRIDPRRLTDLEHDDVLEIREFALGRGAYVRARLALLMAVAEPHDARVVFSSTSTGMVAHAAGFRSDLDVAELMYNSLHQQAANQMSDIRRSTPAATQRFRRSFLFGYADQIGQMLGDARQKVEADRSAPSASGSTDLALQDRIDQVEDHLLRSFGRVRTARAASSAQSGGWNAGSAAADRADVGRTRLAERPAIGPA